MRILMVSQPADGGVSEHVTRLSDGLRRKGHRVTVCGPPGDLEHRLGGDVETLEMTRAVSPAGDAGAVVGLARIVRRLRPDLIHAHSSKAGAVGRAARVAAPGIPVIYTPHGYAFAGFFDREVERRVYRAVERGLAPLASRTLCVCEAEGRLAASVGSARRVRVVHNGIDSLPEGKFAPGLADWRREGPVIGVLSLLRPGKGLETLIDAMPAVTARHPRATVAVAGEGADRAALEARIDAPDYKIGCDSSGRRRGRGLCYGAPMCSAVLPGPSPSHSPYWRRCGSICRLSAPKLEAVPRQCRTPRPAYSCRRATQPRSPKPSFGCATIQRERAAWARGQDGSHASDPPPSEWWKER